MDMESMKEMMRSSEGKALKNWHRNFVGLKEECKSLVVYLQNENTWTGEITLSKWFKKSFWTGGDVSGATTLTIMIAVWSCTRPCSGD